MKKRIYLLITLILSLFIFSGRVEAAKELTCAYQGDFGHATMIVQDSRGNIKFYYYDHPFYEPQHQLSIKPVLEGEDSTYWIEKKGIKLTLKEDKKSEEKLLSNMLECPDYASMYDEDVTKVRFSSKTNAFDTQYTIIYYESQTIIEPEKSNFEGLTCIYEGDKKAKIYNKMLVQDLNGNKFLFSDSNYELTDAVPGWELEKKIDLEFYDIDNNFLTECPSYISSSNKHVVSFSNILEIGLASLPLSESYNFLDNIGALVLGEMKENEPNDSKILERNRFYKDVDYLASDVYKDVKWKGKCIYGSSDSQIVLYVDYNNSKYLLINSRKDVYSANIVTSESKFKASDFELYGQCPLNLYEGYYEECDYMGRCSTGLYAEYNLSSQKRWYTNILNYKEIVLKLDTNLSSWDKYLIDDGDNEPIDDCGDLLGEDVLKVINDIMNWIKIIVPILLIAYGTVDFTKAIFAGKEDDMAKSKKTFFMRILAAVLVFIAPIFINLILDVANEVWSFINPNTCVDMEESK